MDIILEGNIFIMTYIRSSQNKDPKIRVLMINIEYSKSSMSIILLRLNHTYLYINIPFKPGDCLMYVGNKKNCNHIPSKTIKIY